jgi:predicted RNA-binding Zn ribbon-like protein
MTGDKMTLPPPTAAEPRGAKPGSVALELAPPVGTGGDDGVPPGIARVRAFVNTREIDGDEDIEGFASAADLAAWLTAQGLLPGGEVLGEDDLREAIEVREALRELLEGNAGHGVRPAAIRVLRDAGARAPVAVRFDPEDGASLAPVGGGLAAPLGRLFADIATATADGSWARLKVCRNDECRWAYYDASRNRSGRWCSMAGCGNRMKGRAYRERGRSSAATWGSTA